MPKNQREKALESSFSRWFFKEEHRYNAHAISLLSGALGPIQENPNSQLLNGYKLNANTRQKYLILLVQN